MSRESDDPRRVRRRVGRNVEVDLLAPATRRSGGGHRHERIGGEPLARRTEGAELVRSGHVNREISGVLPDGRRHRLTVRVATPAALVILKGLAMSDRDKPKDAYDVDYVLRHIAIEEIAAGIYELRASTPIRHWTYPCSGRIEEPRAKASLSYQFEPSRLAEPPVPGRLAASGSRLDIQPRKERLRRSDPAA
jgi:hypothetical protein